MLMIFVRNRCQANGRNGELSPHHISPKHGAPFWRLFGTTCAQMQMGLFAKARREGVGGGGAAGKERRAVWLRPRPWRGTASGGAVGQRPLHRTNARRSPLNWCAAAMDRVDGNLFVYRRPVYRVFQYLEAWVSSFYFYFPLQLFRCRWSGRSLCLLAESWTRARKLNAAVTPAFGASPDALKNGDLWPHIGNQFLLAVMDGITTDVFLHMCDAKAMNSARGCCYPHNWVLIPAWLSFYAPPDANILINFSKTVYFDGTKDRDEKLRALMRLIPLWSGCCRAAARIILFSMKINSSPVNRLCSISNSLPADDSRAEINKYTKATSPFSQLSREPLKLRGRVWVERVILQRIIYAIIYLFYHALHPRRMQSTR